MAETVSAMTVDGRALYAKISWRLFPISFCCISWHISTA